jgi:predicted Zn-dependent protease
LIFTCTGCGLPFPAKDLLPRSEHLCSDCRAGNLPADLPAGELAAATEREVRLALESKWSFLASHSSSIYLNRLVRQLSRRIEGAPTGCRIVLFDDEAMRTVALPSGLILISLGTIAALEDEAQLAFVVGHELAHAASGDAAVRLVRLGFCAISRNKAAHDPAAWAGAASDLVKLGYGRRRERDADARSMEALLALGYDPGAALRYLRKLESLMAEGDPGVRELSLAHPPPHYRLRRLERMLFGRVGSGEGRVLNREVFQRALGNPAVVKNLARLADLGDPAASGRAGAGWLSGRLWMVFAVLVAALLLLLAGWLF